MTRTAAAAAFEPDSTAGGVESAVAENAETGVGIAVGTEAEAEAEAVVEAAAAAVVTAALLLPLE